MDDKQTSDRSATDTETAGAAPSLSGEVLLNSGLVQLFLGVGICITSYAVYEALTQRYDQQDFAHYYATSRMYLNSGRLDGPSSSQKEEDQRQDEYSRREWETKLLYVTDLRETYAELGWREHEEPIYRPTNPPALIALFSPFATLPPRMAHTLWTLSGVASLILSLWITFSFAREHLSKNAALLPIAVFLFLPFLRHHFTYAQVQLQLMALILVAFQLLRKDRGSMASILVAVAALIKIYPAALLPWFVWRSGESLGKKVAAGFATTITLCAGFWLTDLDAWQAFSEHARPNISNWVKHSQCFTFCSAGERVRAFVTNDNENETFFQTGLGVGIFLFIALYGWIVLSNKRDRKSLLVEFGLLTLLMLTGGATCWWHYLVFLLIPLTALAVCLKRKVSLVAFTLSCLVLSMFLPFQVDDVPGNAWSFLVLYLPFWAMLIMGGFLAYELVTSTPEHS